MLLVNINKLTAAKVTENPNNITGMGNKA